MTKPFGNDNNNNGNFSRLPMLCVAGAVCVNTFHILVNAMLPLRLLDTP